MELGDWKGRAVTFLRKYRFVLLILAVGVVLMTLPEGKEESTASVAISEEQTDTLEEALEDILSRIQGAGKVEVLLTQYRGPETIYQRDTQDSSDSARQDTVVISGSDRQEQGLVRQINPPVYLGALVVCQGGDSPTVRLAIVEAVMSVTGLSSNAITVLKMK